MAVNQLIRILIMLIFILILPVGCSKPPNTASTQVPEPQAAVITPPFVPSQVAAPTHTPKRQLTPTVSLAVTSSTGLTVMLQGDGEINLRGGPGTRYPIVGQVASGTICTPLALSEQGEWLMVSFPHNQDKQAWVFIGLTNYDPALHPLPMATPAAAYP